MPGDNAQRIHVETVMGLFKILGVDVIDVDTIVATYQVPRELAEETLEKGTREGLFGKVAGGGYELTSRGERKLEELVFRSGRVEAPS